jgi:hypothetical protein
MTYNLFMLVLFTHLIRPCAFAIMKPIFRFHIAVSIRATAHTIKMLYKPMRRHEDDWSVRLDYRRSNTKTTLTLR